MPLCTPEYLRERANDRSGFAQAGHREALRDAADEIERLRSALKPFADYSAQIDGNQITRPYGDLCPMTLSPHLKGSEEIIHLGDCRKALAVLSG